MIAPSAVIENGGARFDSASLIALRTHVLKPRHASNALVALPGGFNIRRRGNGQDTAESRAYVPGDDLRHLDRGATARTGHMHTRTFHEERDRVVHLVADFRSSMLWGMRRAFLSVAVAEALALLGWRTVEEGGRVGLIATTASGLIVISPRGRVRGMLDVIGGLVKAQDAAFEAAMDGLTDPPLDGLLDGLKRVTAKGSEIVIATGLNTPGENFENLLVELSQRRFPRLLVVQDRTARNLPAGRYPMEVSDGTRITARFGRRSKEIEPGNSDISLRLGVGAAIPKLDIDADATLDELVRQLGI